MTSMKMHIFVRTNIEDKADCSRSLIKGHFYLSITIISYPLANYMRFPAVIFTLFAETNYSLKQIT